MLDGEGFSLVRAVEADAAAVRALTREAYAKWVPVIGREPLPMNADYVQAVQRNWIDLLHVEGVLAALIEMSPADDHLYIVNVAVRPAFAGKGIGRELLRHAERVAAAAGYSRVRLLTNQAMVANVRLYERIGYRIDREAAFDGGFVVHMSKELGPRPDDECVT